MHGINTITGNYPEILIIPIYFFIILGFPMVMLINNKSTRQVGTLKSSHISGVNRNAHTPCSGIISRTISGYNSRCQCWRGCGHEGWFC